MKKKKYRTKLIRRHHIPKANGKLRALGIPAMEDKLVQYAAMQILSTIYEQDFLNFSYGYRPNKSAICAVKDLRETLSRPCSNYVVEADIKSFFDMMDHKWIIKMLEQRVDDRAFIGLIKKWLKAGILDESGKVIHPVTGSPQGGIISPIIANVYMHYVLNLWFEKVVKKYCKGEARVFVYADDFVCVFEYRKDADRFYKALIKRLSKFNLEVSPEKTNVISFRKWMNTKVDFLGFEFRLTRTKKRYIRLRTSRVKLKSSFRNARIWCKRNRWMKLKEYMKSLNRKLTGYYNYFGISGNYESLRRFYLYIVKTVFRALNRRSQKKSYNWEGFNAMLKHYSLIKPRIRHFA